MNTLIKTIEDLSLNAWPSHQIELYDGWILRFSYFYTHRTNSVEQIGPSTIPVEEKVALLEEAFKGKASNQLVGLLTATVEKGRFAEIENILAYFESKVLEYKKIGIAHVTSASALTDQQKEEVQKRLLETTSYKSIQTEYQVDASLIGGIVIQIGDRVVDGSIRTQLGNMAKELSKIQLVK